MSDYEFPKPLQEEIDEAMTSAKREFPIGSFMHVLAGAYQESQRQVAEMRDALIAERQAAPKPASPYRIKRPEGMPEWVTRFHTRTQWDSLIATPARC